MTAENKAAVICAKLIGKKVVHKNDVKDIFRDENLRIRVEDMLKTVGLELATHIYTDHVALKVGRDMEQHVFDDHKGGYLTANINLNRGAITLLVIIWAKLIMPKRQMQIERKSPDDNSQLSLLSERKPIPKSDLVRLEEKALRTDFGKKLGGKTMFGKYMSELSRHGFIVRREGIITEGPLLDTIIDYHVLANRIIEGCLKEVIDTEKKDVSL